jgi:hypothetical protein
VHDSTKSDVQMAQTAKVNTEVVETKSCGCSCSKIPGRGHLKSPASTQMLEKSVQGGKGKPHLCWILNICRQAELTECVYRSTPTAKCAQQKFHCLTWSLLPR